MSEKPTNTLHEVRNPATGQVVGTLDWTDPVDIPGIVARLAHEQRQWAAREIGDRVQVMSKFGRWIADHADEIVAQLLAETGKSKADTGVEIPLVLAVISYYTGNAEQFLGPQSPGAPPPLLAIKSVQVHYRPRGVVGIIPAWNYPAANCFMDTIGALLAGNAVLLKSPERTPFTGALMARGWAEVGGPPVLHVAQGAADVGEALIDTVDYVQFTGSTATGKKVAERAARRLTPVSLELGGKDPMIVLDDADLVRAAHAAVWGAMFNAGQTCVAVERVYVQDAVYDEFVRLVVDEVRDLRVGAGIDDGFGAMIDEGQLAVVDRHVQQALAAGARALTGGARTDGPGTFYPPTVLVDVDHSMACMREETFGPTLPIMKVAGEAEAIALANDSEYGLSASVWSRDRKRAERVALQLDCGTVNVNDVIINLSILSAPHGGWKASGIGARFGGADGIRKYCRTEVIVGARFPGRVEPNWYAAPKWLRDASMRMLTESFLLPLRWRGR